MKVLGAVFRKEWTEAKRDPRAWLLTLVVPVLFYPGAVLIGAGGVGSGPLRVAVGDPWLAGRIDALDDVVVASPTADGGIDAEVTVVSRDPGFPEHGSILVDVRFAGRSLLAGERLDQALRRVARQVAGERAERVGLVRADLDPIRHFGAGGETVAGTAGSSPLIAYLLVFVMFTGCLATAVDTGAGERERGGMEAMLATPAPPLEIAAGKIVFIMLTGIASVLASLAGLALAVRAAGGGVDGVAGGLGGVAVSALLLVPCAGMIASWLFACSLGARSAREAHAWISGVFLLVSLGLIWMTFGAGAGRESLAWMPLFGAAAAIGGVLDGECAAGCWILPWLTTATGWLLGLLLCARLLRREAVIRAW